MKKMMALVLATGLTFVTLSTSSLDRTTGASNIIDGAENPQMIPDRVAYSLILRLISSGRNEPENRRLKSYVARIGLSSDSDVQAIFSAAEEFERKINALDGKVNTIKEQERRDHSVRSTESQQLLQQLQSQYDSITDEIVKSLLTTLSEDGKIKLEHFMDRKFKKNVKLRPSGSPVRK